MCGQLKNNWFTSADAVAENVIEEQHLISDFVANIWINPSPVGVFSPSHMSLPWCPYHDFRFQPSRGMRCLACNISVSHSRKFEIVRKKAIHNNVIMSRDFLTYSIVLLQFRVSVTQVVSENTPLCAYIVNASLVFYLHKPR